MLPKFAELNTTTRGNPCQEYPGIYHIYIKWDDGITKELHTFSAECGETAAYQFLYRVIGAYEDYRKFSLAWQASDNDPRIGQVWFTGYYTLDTRR